MHFVIIQLIKKLAGGIEGTATWMTNIANEYGEVLNCVLTTGEGAGLDDLCQGIVRRYRDAGERQPDVIYVDRDCCSDKGGLRCMYFFLTRRLITGWLTSKFLIIL